MRGVRRGLVVAALAAVALLAIGGASSTAAPPTKPTLTLERDCTTFGPGFHGVKITLTNFPPNSSASGTVTGPDGGTFGATVPIDANGGFSISLGSTEPGTFTVTIEDPVSLTESLFVDCSGPGSKADCKRGGWRDFPQFRNQGQCVAFVERGPKGG
jgi:hypothetical protein